MRQHPGVQGSCGPWRVRPVAGAAKLARGFFLLSLLAIIPVVNLSIVTIVTSGPAVAGGDDDSRQQREEQRRERERERAEREDARLQREQERQARAHALAQEREARFQASENNPGEQQAVTADKLPQHAGDNTATPVKIRDSDGGERSQSGSERASSNSGSDGSQSGEGPRWTSEQTRNSGSEDQRGNEQADGKDEASREAIAVYEHEEPPRTLVEWFNRLGEQPKPQATHGGSGELQTPASTTAQEPIRGAGATSHKPVSAAPAAAGKTAATAKPDGASATASKMASTPVQTGPRHTIFDAELLRLGEIRQRQILASGLDQTAVSKASAMGFKTSASAKSPGSTTPVVSLTVPGGMSEAAAQEWLQQSFPDARFGPNHVYHIYPAAESAVAPSSPSKGACRGPGCYAESLLKWKSEMSACARGVRIGVIDTSFDMSHAALKGRNYDLKDFRRTPMKAGTDWHGTAVLSVLAGDPASATPGLVPGANYLLAATFGVGQDGQASADALSVLAALSWLDGKADIVNMSFSGPRNEEIELAIRAMATNGVVFIAAAGNRGPNGPASYPAAYSEVIAVTAVTQDGRGYRNATHGDYVDVAAPGVDVFTALPNGKTGLRTGTSFAAPFVTGLLAAMPAARHGVMSKSDLMARISIKDLGAPGRDPVFGEGLPQAPAHCDEIGGVASLPWSPEARQMSLGAAGGDAALRGTRADEPAGVSSMGWAMGFAP